MGFTSKSRQIVSLLSIIFVQVYAITTRLERAFSSPTENHPLYLGNLPIPDWEIGLREAIYRALTSERSVRVKNLEEYIHQAPLLGRQNYASPFGDIAIIARGQLYSAPGGFELLQDLYQNDCDGCHNKPPKCGRVKCENWKPYDHERLLALWSVKRIRHRDQKYGYRYEFEYKISPMSMVANERFVTRNGNFDYSVTGRFYLARADPEQTLHNPPDRPSGSFDTYEKPNWNDSPSQYLPPPIAIPNEFYHSNPHKEGYPGILYDSPLQPYYTTTTEKDVIDKDFEKELFNGVTSKTSTTRKTTTNFTKAPSKMTTPYVSQSTAKPSRTTGKPFLPTIPNDLKTTSKEGEQNESAQATSILTEITPILGVTENISNTKKYTSYTTISPAVLITRTTDATIKPQIVQTTPEYVTRRPQVTATVQEYPIKATSKDKTTTTTLQTSKPQIDRTSGEYQTSTLPTINKYQTIKPQVSRTTKQYPTRKPQLSTKKPPQPSKSRDDLDIFGDDSENDRQTKATNKPNIKDQRLPKPQSTFHSDLFDDLPTKKPTQTPNRVIKGSSKAQDSMDKLTTLSIASVKPITKIPTRAKPSVSTFQPNGVTSPSVPLDSMSKNSTFPIDVRNSNSIDNQTQPATKSPFEDLSTTRILSSSSKKNQTVRFNTTPTSLFDDQTAANGYFSSNKPSKKSQTVETSTNNPSTSSIYSNSDKVSTRGGASSDVYSTSRSVFLDDSSSNESSSLTSKMPTTSPNDLINKATTSSTSFNLKNQTKPTRSSASVSSSFDDATTAFDDSKQLSTEGLSPSKTPSSKFDPQNVIPTEDTDFIELTTAPPALQDITNATSLSTPSTRTTTLQSVQTKRLTTEIQVLTLPTKKMFASTNTIIYSVPLTTTRQTVTQFSTPRTKITTKIEPSDATDSTIPNIVTVPTWLTTVQSKPSRLPSEATTRNTGSTAKMSSREDFPSSNSISPPKVSQRPPKVSQRPPKTTPFLESTTENLEIVYPVTKASTPQYSVRPPRTKPTTKVPPKPRYPKPTLSTTYLPAAPEDVTTKPPLVMPPTVKPHKPIENRRTTFKPSKANDFDLDLFGDAKNDPSTKRMRKTKTPKVLLKSKEDDDIFGFEETPQKVTKRPLPDYNYIDSDIQPPKPDPKIIYSDFYSPSSTRATTETTTTTEAQHVTKKSFITSVSYKVNKKESPTTPYSTESTTAQFEATTETDIPNNDEVTINKSELIKIIQKMCNETKIEADAKALDALALTVLNNAKSITYLKAQQDRMARRAKYKRKSNYKAGKSRRPP